jgi:hypothetical protein
MQCEHVLPLPPLLRIPNWGGGSLAAPLFLERGATLSWTGSVRTWSCRPRWPSGLEPGALVANMAKAWARRNSDHVGPIRRGAGPTGAAEHVRDGRGGDRDAQLEQLSLDPQVAPSGVLSGHPNDQVA